MGISQDLNPILDRFSAFEVNETVQIECVISSGSTCNGIDVLRSTDSINYEIIGNISGVCGNSASPVRYQFEDNNPKLNAPNYYKLELGGYGFTRVLSVVIRDIEDGKLQVAPNPAYEITQINFKNPVNQTFQLSVRNLSGELIYQKETTGEEFEINVSSWNSGYYAIQLYSEESKSSKVGVLMVVH
jgi:hypothetical protein